MRTLFKTLAVLSVAALLSASSCEMPQAQQVAPKSKDTAKQTDTLDPAAPLEGLDRLELKVIWRHDLGQIAQGKTIRQSYVAGNTLVVETLDGTLFYFDAITGVWRASTRLKAPLAVPPAAHGKMLYAVTDRAFLVIDTETGVVKNQLPPNLPVNRRPVVYGEDVVLAGGNGNVVLFRLPNGQQQWTASAGASVNDAPVIDGDVIFAAGHKGRLTAVNGETGVAVWTWEPRFPSLLTSGVELGTHRVYVGDNRGYVYSLTTHEGVTTWKYPAGAPISQTPVFVREKLLVFTYNGDTLCLDVGKDEPVLLWKSADASRLIAAGKRHLYLLTRDGSLSRVLLETGKEDWRLPLGKGCAITSRPREPVFYVYRPSGQIAALSELD
jgi:outer membrane protein assembly factor BamB